MSAQDDGGPVSSTMTSAGMSLRDAFAAKALAGLSDPSLLDAAYTEEEIENAIVNAAVLSYRLADAMLKARQA